MDQSEIITETVNNGNTSPPLEKPKEIEKPTEEVENKEKKKKYYNTQVAAKNIWIIKPGENTNQGQGIKVAKEF